MDDVHLFFRMIAIIDYEMGNVHSVLKAFETTGEEVLISHKKEDLQRAEAIILPGVGAFGVGMENLRKLGLVDVLYTEVIIKKKPFLGICLGMQLLAEESEEFGKHLGLGWIPAKIKKFNFPFSSLRVPHVGWNNLFLKKENPLFNNFKGSPDFYFVHSYFMDCRQSEAVIARCDYGGLFTAAVQKENIFGVQFHPEKSQKAGLAVIKNFVGYVKNNTQIEKSKNLDL